MTPHEIQINDRDQAEVSAVAGRINHLLLAKTNDGLGKHLDNELYKDG